MKKVIIGIVIVLTLLGVGLFQAIPALADSTGPLSSAEISPVNPTVVPGGTIQFTAQAYDNTDAAIAGASYFWMVTSGGGTITQSGLFTAGTIAGTYTNTVEVVAVKGNYSATLNTSVTVLSAGALDHVAITPSSATVQTGGTQQFTAQGYDDNDIAISGLTYDWLMVSGSGSISNTGLYAAPGSTGSAIISVTVNGTSVSASAGINIVSTVGTLNHITIIPVSSSVQTGKTRQFSAQGYDAGNAAISGLTYTWTVVNSGGSINSTGLFTAGSTTGIYTNTVQVTVSGSNVYGYASVTVTANPAVTPVFDINRIIRTFGGLVNTANFDNFLGGQWQVKNGTAVDTVKVIPGVVVSYTASTSLVITPNGQTSNATYALTTSTVLRPKDATLSTGDKVVVVTVNDQVKMVVKINTDTTTESQRMPPGLRKHQENREGKNTPSGWFNGNKTGWGNKSGNNGGNN